MTARRAPQLSCGRELPDLVAQVADGWAPHAATHAACPHCGHTVQILERLWARLQELATEEVPAPRSIETMVVRRLRRELVVAAAVQALRGVLSRLSLAFVRYGRSRG